MTNAYPQFTAATVQLNALPYQDTFLKIANVYADSTRASMEQLWISSSRIIMEETIKAFIAASQSCAEALTRNAVAVQQQSFGRLINANQKAVELMGQSFAEAMSAGWKPAR
ncbi:hypothetical protein [Telluria beijingensis]|uniref:hypothetical protein n=1 Tax=Telluria beijingensis TaxID=3068633 RepID=UPI00279598D7|nr:hypothetical protein [Massilia sp. REN29]